MNAQRRGGQTPLFAACANGFGSVAAALLVKWQADPTLARDADGATCLHVVSDDDDDGALDPKGNIALPGYRPVA